MKSTVETLEPTKVRLTVEIPVEELKSEMDKAYKSIANQVSIPGFRKGHVPARIIDQRFGRAAVIEQVVNEVLPGQYSAAVSEHELRPMSQPDVEVTEIPSTSGELTGQVVFTAEVDVVPSFELPEYGKDTVIEVDSVEVTDEDVQAELDALRGRFASLKPIKRQAKTGDFTTIDLVATINGEEVDSVSDVSYEIGSGTMLDGQDTALRKTHAGDVVTFTSTLKGGEHEGEEAEVTITVKSVKERELPELDDDFAQMASEFDTVEELRADLASGAEESAKAEQAASIREEVLKVALEKTQFPLPASVVDEQVNAQVQQLMGQLGGDEALFEKLLEAQGTSREEFNEQTRTSAEEAVRTQLFLDVLAEKEEPEVTQDELNDHIVFTARRYGVEPQQFLMQLQQSGQLLNLVSDVRRGKALANAICSVTVKDSDGNDVDPKIYFGDEEETAQDSDES